MKKIYIDSEYRCHTTNPDGTFREVERKLIVIYEESLRAVGVEV